MPKMRIILCGPGASGKDYFREFLIGKGYSFGISSTTREPRPGETPGVTYHYLTREDFDERVRSGKMLEWCEFSGWLYGTDAEDFGSKEVFIMTPSGMAQLTEDALDGSVIVYFNIPEDVRRRRLEDRFEKHPSGDTPDRRINTDALNFAGFSRYDMEITDPAYDPESVLAAILDYAGKRFGNQKNKHVGHV